MYTVLHDKHTENGNVDGIERLSAKQPYFINAPNEDLPNRFMNSVYANKLVTNALPCNVCRLL